MSRSACPLLSGPLRQLCPVGSPNTARGSSSLHFSAQTVSFISVGRESNHLEAQCRSGCRKGVRPRVIIHWAFSHFGLRPLDSRPVARWPPEPQPSTLGAAQPACRSGVRFPPPLSSARAVELLRPVHSQPYPLLPPSPQRTSQRTDPKTCPRSPALSHQNPTHNTTPHIHIHTFTHAHI